MKRTSLLILPAIVLASLSYLFNDSMVGAQTDPAGRARVSISPTPTPSPTPPKIKEEEEIFKVDTELVNLNVRVIDRNNRPINGLQQKDFKIFEDSETQQIEFFSKSEVPTNYALVIDNSGSLRSQLEKVIEAGKIIVGRINRTMKR